MSKINDQLHLNDPEKRNYPIKLGRYSLLKSIAKGGMGEIFLAKDPICKRQVALKILTPVEKKEERLKALFCKEVEIAAQLSHPCIMPIFEFVDDGNNVYYTMPYLEGYTLKKIIIASKLSSSIFKSAIITNSISSSVRLFLQICKAVEYTHNRGYLHRDLKPENIMIGNFSDVTILDWGLAVEIADFKSVNTKGGIPNQKKGEPTTQKKTNPAGTRAYQAPEIAFGMPATVQSDIYSLGSILYYMLTYELPVNERPKKYSEWRKKLLKNGLEIVCNPHDRAPQKDISRALSKITMKCLTPILSERYKNIAELVIDIDKYLEGAPEWIATQSYRLNVPSDWEFHESILMTKQMAISRYAGVMEWISLILTREKYSENIQISFSISVQEKCNGIGIILCIPTNNGRESLSKGYLIWIGSKSNPGAKLLRDNTEVKNVNNVFLEPNKASNITLEKLENTITLFIDNEKKLTYTCYLPIVGGHFAVAAKDFYFKVSPIQLSVGSHNVMVKCLSIPDAFLLNQDYDQALIHYRRISNSFKGRSEGRDAIFRAGLALIEKALKTNNQTLLVEAHKEFEILDKTPGEPLSYLGKSLICKAEGSIDEELKYLEIGVRKFPKHPLRLTLDEHIIFRLQETAQTNRIGGYQFALLVLQHIPKALMLNETKKLLRNLTTSWETLPFMHYIPSFKTDYEENFFQATLIAFWLSKPNIIYEQTQLIKESYIHKDLLYQNCILALYQLDYTELIRFIIEKDTPSMECKAFKSTILECISGMNLKKKINNTEGNFPLLLNILLSKYLNIANGMELRDATKNRSKLDFFYIWSSLISNQEFNENIFNEKAIFDPSSIYFVLYGCYLAKKMGISKARDHLNLNSELPFPRSPAFLSCFLNNPSILTSKWFEQAFLWEKIQLLKQISLFKMCINDKKGAIEAEGLVSIEIKAHKIPFMYGE